MPRTLRDTKVALPPLQNGNLHGAQRPVTVIHSNFRNAATKWSAAFLEGYETPELQTALATLKQHPQLTAPGYNKARDAHNRVEAEIQRRGS
jgi:hypothetical protein